MQTAIDTVANDRIRSQITRRSKHVRHWNKIELREVPCSYSHLRPRSVFIELKEHIIDFLLRLRNNPRPVKKSEWVFSSRNTHIAIRAPSNIVRKARKIIPPYALQRCQEVQFDNSATNLEIMKVISRMNKISKYLKRAALNFPDAPSAPYTNILKVPQLRWLFRKTLIYATLKCDDLSIRGGQFVRLSYSNSKPIGTESKNPMSVTPSVEDVKSILEFVTIFKGITLSDRVLSKMRNIRILALDFCHSGKYARELLDLDERDRIVNKEKFQRLCSAVAKFITLESLCLVIEGSTGCFQEFGLFTKTISVLTQLKKLDLFFVKPSSDFTDYLSQLAKAEPFTTADNLTMKLKFEEDTDLHNAIQLLPKNRSKGISAYFEISFEFYFQSEIVLAFEQEGGSYCLSKFGSKLPKYNRLLQKFYVNKIDVADIYIKVDLTIDFNATSLLGDLDRLSNYCPNLRRLKLDILHTLGVLPHHCNSWLNALKNLGSLLELDISFPEIRNQEPLHSTQLLDKTPKPIKILVEHMEKLKSLKTFQLKFEGRFFGCQFLKKMAEAISKLESFERLIIIAGCVGESEGEHLLDLMAQDEHPLALLELKLLNVNKLFNDKTDMSNFLANPLKIFDALDGCLELFRNATLKIVFGSMSSITDEKKILRVKRTRMQVEKN